LKRAPSPVICPGLTVVDDAVTTKPVLPWRESQIAAKPTNIVVHSG
jgi:hypothetical protein